MAPVPDDRTKRLLALSELLEYAMAESRDLGMPIATQLIDAARLGALDELKVYQLPPKVK
jgi:hypothetical protein